MTKIHNGYVRLCTPKFTVRTDINGNMITEICFLNTQIAKIWYNPNTKPPENSGHFTARVVGELI